MIPFVDLATQQEHIRESLNRRMADVLAHGKYIIGPEVGELEQKLASYVGVKHCIACANGTDALLIALMALGVKAGDEVITTAFTYVATGEVIARLGATPIFVDIDERTYNINPTEVKAAITEKTKAIIPVSLYGQCADFDAINAIAEEYGLAVIEDGAQSFGATYKGKRSCNLSTIGCTSFFPTKPLGCYGDGGACFTNDDDLAAAIDRIHRHGQDRRYHHVRMGLNSRLDTLQAAVLLAKMEIFDEEVRRRECIGKKYTELLKDNLNVITPSSMEGNTSVYAQYTIRVRNRDEVRARLEKRGIPTAIHYPIPLNMQPMFNYLRQKEAGIPVAEKAAQEVLSLPMSAWVKDEDLAMIVEVMRVCL